MGQTGAAATGRHPFVEHRRVLAASLVGTAVEFYDFYVYATAAALVFGPLFFPSTSDTAQLMLAYLSFGLAFLARPLGAVLFGHFGDRVGRKSTLVASLMLMGGSTLLIAFLPTYQMVGWVAPLLLCLLRVGQGIGLGGEWGGATLLAVENAPPGWRTRFGMWPQLGAPIGFIAANGLFLLLGLGLDERAFVEWGWRVPFLFSAVLVGLGLWVRLKISETPEFRAILDREPPARIPLGELLARDLPALMAGTLVVIACFAIFYISTAFALGHATTALGYTRTEFLLVQLGAILFLAAGIWTAGYWSDAKGAWIVLAGGCAATIVAGLVFGSLLGGDAAFHAFLALSLALFVMGFVYGPLGSWLPEQFPVRVRYTGASVAFNVAGILGGALAPNIALWLATEGGTEAVGWYLSAAGLISFVGLLWSRKATGQRVSSARG